MLFPKAHLSFQAAEIIGSVTLKGNASRYKPWPLLLTFLRDGSLQYQLSINLTMVKFVPFWLEHTLDNTRQQQNKIVIFSGAPCLVLWFSVIVVCTCGQLTLNGVSIDEEGTIHDPPLLLEVRSFLSCNFFLWNSNCCLEDFTNTLYMEALCLGIRCFLV